MAAADFVADQPEAGVARFIDQFQGSEHEKIFRDAQTQLLEMPMDAEHFEVEFRDGVKRLQEHRLRARVQWLTAKAGSSELSVDERSELSRGLERLNTFKQGGETPERVV